MLFDSARLTCRKMTLNDAELYHTWRNDLEVMQSTSPCLDAYELEETKDFVQHVILGSPSSKSYLILLKETGRPIGIMSLIHIDTKNGTRSVSSTLAKRPIGAKGTVLKR